jgi:hypothetical protein
LAKFRAKIIRTPPDTCVRGWKFIGKYLAQNMGKTASEAFRRAAFPCRILVRKPIPIAWTIPTFPDPQRQTLNMALDAVPMVGFGGSTILGARMTTVETLFERFTRSSSRAPFMISKERAHREGRIRVKAAA